MKTLLAPAALLDAGWATDVALTIDDDGRIARVDRNAGDRAAERLAGPVIPAMPNLHSHAFQRAIAGRTGSPFRVGLGMADRQPGWLGQHYLDAEPGYAGQRR